MAFAKNITIKNLTIDTDKVLGTKSTRHNQLSADASEKIVIDGLKITAPGYNAIEINLSYPHQESTDIEVRNVVHTGQLSHNGVNIYATGNDSIINIENVDFSDMSAGSGDGQFLRLTNYKDTSNVTINVKNCHMTSTYMGNIKTGEYDRMWATFAFAQDDFTDSTYEDYSSWKINFENCTYNGDPVLIENGNVFGIWRSKGDGACEAYIEADGSCPDYFPTVTTTNTMSEAELKKYKDRFKALCGDTFASKPVNDYIK